MEKGSVKNDYSVVLIGGSAGSLEVIMQILPVLPEHIQAALVIILHRKNDDSLLSKILSNKTSLPVVEAEDKTSIMSGTIYIAPADYHLLIEKDKTFSLDYSEKINYSRPSIDVTFETATEAYGNKLAAFLLSGANADGAAGLLSVKNSNGLSVVQDPKEATVEFMPESAIRMGAVNSIMNLEEMKNWFASLSIQDHQTLRGHESP
jgi:two-component system, chemotaxis family, protein-glutamate methylesterase/glutaminase